jgi:hypothetical protein
MFMVQAIENLTCIQGIIRSRRPHASLPEYDTVTVDITDTQAVAGKADLLSQHVGSQIQLTVRRELLGNALPGVQLRCRAKRTADGAMCEPYPASADFSVKP